MLAEQHDFSMTWLGRPAIAWYLGLGYCQRGFAPSAVALTPSLGNWMNGMVGCLYEFLAGAGMAGVGHGVGWRCLFAGDFNCKKGAMATETSNRDIWYRGRIADNWLLKGAPS